MRSITCEHGKTWALLSPQYSNSSEVRDPQFQNIVDTCLNVSLCVVLVSVSLATTSILEVGSLITRVLLAYSLEG